VNPGKKYQTKRAVLLLADGTRFEGDGLGPDATALGEAVFYTGMTGYEEALTDPSYAGQILTFTYPLIGNYGVSRSVSQHPHGTVSGCVIKHLARRPSHFENVVDLGTWLEEQAIPTIIGVDTRALTIALREHGTIGAALAIGDKAVAAADATLAEYVRTMTTSGLVASVADAYETGETIGPGDPRDLPATVETLRGFVGEVPMFGVCLGHQLLALACDAQTFKLPYGHRGGNQPVKDLINDEVLITAHNHGYAVDGATLPDHLEATMVNLNDGTNEGFRHRTLPIAAVQFHPEASPGPFDARGLFRGWLDSLR
jgi:carbamoyl-phosphate synthase small subunit